MSKSVSAKGVQAAAVYQALEVHDLTGGMDLRRTPTLVAPNRSVLCRNFSLSEPGALRVRPGYQAFSSLASTRAAQGAGRIYLASTQGSLVATQGQIYLLPDSGTWPSTSVAQGFSTSSPMFFTFDRNLVGAFDGVTRPQKSTNLVNWTRLGIEKSSNPSTLSLSSQASDLSTSQFSIVYTYKDRGLTFESDPIATASTIALTSTGNAIVVQIPNSTDPQVDAIVVYAKNVTAGETVFRKASSGAQSGGASSTLIITSSNWSANDEAPSSHGTPPILSYGVNWKNRWWARSAEFPTRLYFTELFQPQGWPALFYIDLPFTKGEEINAIQPQGDTLLVMGASQIYLVIGQTSLDFEVRPSLGAQSGALGPNATTLVEAGVAHVSAEGIYIFDGATDRLLSFDETPGWHDLIDNAPSTSLARISIVYDWNLKELRTGVPRLFPTAAPGEWVLDLNRTREQTDPAWAQTDRNILHYLFWDGDEPVAGNRGKLQSLPSTGVKVFTEAVGQTADGGNMSAEYDGPTFATGLNRARFVDVHTEYEPHDGNLTVEVLTDGQSQGQLPLGIGAGLSVYGTATYGVSAYGGAGRRKAYTTLPLSADGRNVQAKYVYEGQEDFALFTYAIGMVPEVAPRQFSE